MCEKCVFDKKNPSNSYHTGSSSASRKSKCILSGESAQCAHISQPPKQFTILISGGK